MREPPGSGTGWGGQWQRAPPYTPLASPVCREIESSLIVPRARNGISSGIPGTGELICGLLPPEAPDKECSAGVRNRAWPPSIILSRHHLGQPCFKRNQVEGFPPENNEQQQSRVREPLLPQCLHYRWRSLGLSQVIPTDSIPSLQVLRA